MPTLSLGNANVSARVKQLLKESYERENLPPGKTTTAVQVLTWIHQDQRTALAQRVKEEKRLQRQEAAQAEDDTLDGEVTVT